MVVLKSLRPQSIQPGSRFYLFFEEMPEIAADNILKFKGEFPVYFNAAGRIEIGAVLQVEDFKRIGKRPVIVLIGSCSQFLIMPIGAFMLAKLFRLPPELAVGLILTCAAPGAMASNVMSYIARADTAYSVSLTTVSTLLCPVLTPGITFMLARSTLPIPFLKMFLSVVYMVVLPLFAGFGVRHFFKKQVEKILSVFQKPNHSPKNKRHQRQCKCFTHCTSNINFYSTVRCIKK